MFKAQISDIKGAADIYEVEFLLEGGLKFHGIFLELKPGAAVGDGVRIGFKKPLSAGKKPAMMRSSVVLPLPLRPYRQTNEPFFISKRASIEKSSLIFFLQSIVIIFFYIYRSGANVCENLVALA